jgi:hypothetical protein
MNSPYSSRLSTNRLINHLKLTQHTVHDRDYTKTGIRRPLRRPIPGSCPVPDAGRRVCLPLLTISENLHFSAFLYSLLEFLPARRQSIQPSPSADLTSSALSRTWNPLALEPSNLLTSERPTPKASLDSAASPDLLWLICSLFDLISGARCHSQRENREAGVNPARSRHCDAPILLRLGCRSQNRIGSLVRRPARNRLCSPLRRKE